RIWTFLILPREQCPTTLTRKLNLRSLPAKISANPAHRNQSRGTSSPLRIAYAVNAVKGEVRGRARQSALPMSISRFHQFCRSCTRCTQQASVAIQHAVGVVGDSCGPVGEDPEDPDLAGQHVESLVHVAVFLYGDVIRIKQPVETGRACASAEI